MGPRTLLLGKKEGEHVMGKGWKACHGRSYYCEERFFCHSEPQMRVRVGALECHLALSWGHGGCCMAMQQPPWPRAKARWVTCIAVTATAEHFFQPSGMVVCDERKCGRHGNTRIVNILPIVSENNAPLQTCDLSTSYPPSPQVQCCLRLSREALTKRSVFSASARE